MPYTSNKKPGGLDAATSLTGTNNIVVDQAGTVVKATLNQVEAQMFAAKTQVTPVNGDVVVIRRGSDIRQMVVENMLPAGSVTNAMLGGSIADSKLNQLTTAGKVANSATTATNANTASAIVARDASGNFTAGTITATLSGNASTASNLSSNRTFALTGDVTGSVSSDLSSGASIATSIAAGSIVDADVSGSAAIALSKLATGALPTAITVASANLVDGTIVNADVNASAAIAGTKIAPDFGSQSINTTGNVQTTGGIITVASNTQGSFVNSAAGNDTNCGLIQFRKSRGTNAAPSTVSSGDALGSVAFFGYDGAQNSLSAQVVATSEGTIASDRVPTRLTVATRGTAGGYAERVRITPDGNVGIGRTSPSTALDVNGTVTATAFSGPLTGNVTGNATGNAGTATTWQTGRNLALTGDVTATLTSVNGSANVSAAATIANNVVTDAKLRDSAGLSVVGRASDSSGDPADIVAASDNHVLRRSGTSVGFGTVATGGIADAAVTAAKLNGAQTGSAPIFGARAWVVFNGTVSANIGGTYTRTGTTVEVITTVPHGQRVNHRVGLDFTSGTATDGGFTVTSVISDTKFTVTHGTSGATSGNVTLLRQLINASGNVSNVARTSTGSFWINFTTDVPPANAVVATSNTGNVAALTTPLGESRATISCRDTAWALDDPSLVSVVVFA